MKTETKHPDFNEWILTKTGKECNNINNLVGEQPFLQNRLFWAFDAGRNCIWDQLQESKSRVSDLEKRNIELSDELTVARESYTKQSIKIADLEKVNAELVKCLKMADECLSDGIEIEKNDPVHKIIKQLIQKAKAQ
jgi:hypothetical protein